MCVCLCKIILTTVPFKQCYSSQNQVDLLRNTVSNVRSINQIASKNDRLRLTSFTTIPAHKLKKKKTHQIDSTASSSDRMRLITTSNTWEWTKQLLYLVNLSGESAGVDASLTRPHPLISVSSQIQTMKLLALTERRQTIRINRQLVPSRLLTEQPRLSRVQGRLIRCRPEINSWLNEGRLGQTPDHTLGFTAS